MKHNKDTYEPPRAMRLTALDGGAGDCKAGSSDDNLCYNSGNTAGGDCFASGVTATSQCSWDGNTAAYNSCYNGGEPY